MAGAAGGVDHHQFVSFGAGGRHAGNWGRLGRHGMAARQGTVAGTGDAIGGVIKVTCRSPGGGHMAGGAL